MKNKIDCKQFINIKNSEVAYFLGFLWADGCIYTKKKHSYLIQITIVSDDFKYLRPILKKIGDWNYNKYKPKPIKWKEKTSAAAYSKELVTWLYSVGYINKENPHNIINIIPIELRKFFWRGLFDGDGNVTCTDKTETCGIASSYNQDWSALKDLCKELNIKYFIQRRDRDKGKCSNFGISNRDGIINFLSFIYDGYNTDKIGFNRKYKKIKMLVINKDKYLKRRTSTHRGIAFRKDKNKWVVFKRINGIDKQFYGFISENDALEFQKTLINNV